MKLKDFKLNYSLVIPYFGGREKKKKTTGGKSKLYNLSPRIGGTKGPEALQRKGNKIMRGTVQILLSKSLISIYVSKRIENISFFASFGVVC